MMTCNACGKTMDSGARFCSACGAVVNEQFNNQQQGYQRAYSQGAPAGYAQGYAVPVPTQLFRPRMGRAIAGVCSGFALRYGWDVTLVRVALVALVVLGCGSPILAYLIAWIVMPNEQYSLPPYTPYAQTAAPPPPAPSAPYSGETGPTAS